MLLIGVIMVFAPVIDRLRHQPSVDLTLSGGMHGTMRNLSNWHNFGSDCSIATEHSLFFGDFAGTVGKDHLGLQIVIYQYHGQGTYTQDAADGPSDVVRPLDILVSTIPESARQGTFPPQGGTAYSSRHIPVLALVAKGTPAPGQSSLTMNPDGKSARIDAQLDFGNAADGRPVRVVGSFNCGRVGKTIVHAGGG